MNILRKAVLAKKFGEKGFNCWGLTAYILGWIERPEHLTDEQMIQLIWDHADPDGQGDLVVFYYEVRQNQCDRVLVHSALMLDDEHILHKDGDNEIRIDLLSDVRKWHKGLYKKYELWTPMV
jgi:hypothetical protein